MARRAFVMASNGSEHFRKLKYAVRDAERISQHLSGPRCNFEIIRPSQNATKGQVLDQLERVAYSCKPEDTLLFYFAGHGELERGRLFLLWDMEATDVLGAGISFARIREIFDDSMAEGRLIILDCCRAGAAVGARAGAGLPVEEVVARPDNYQILMASGRLEEARELDKLEAGFMTHAICEALDSQFDKAINEKDRQLSLQGLKSWLQSSAIAYNKDQKKTASHVPVPFLYGQSRGEFYLTDPSRKWKPYELTWPDGSTMVVLPISPHNDRVLCIGKHPITNAQYRRFVEEGGGKEPIGQSKVSEKWVARFRPWKQPSFSAPDQPAVCVSYNDAVSYCKWANGLPNPAHKTRCTLLPTRSVWNFATFGTARGISGPSILDGCPNIHHKSDAPASIDITGSRSNHLGISDLLGNVWEWCEKDSYGSASGYVAYRSPELRGGGFLDDLAEMREISLFSHIFFRGENIQKADHMRHFDLGFRIAALVLGSSLPVEVRHRLALCAEWGWHDWPRDTLVQHNE